SQTITVPISEDLLDELDETFTVNLANASNATIADTQGIGTIVDNDGPPAIAINDVTVNEGAGTVTFTVSLDAASGLPVSVDYSMADGTAGALDYTAGSGTLTFAAGITSQTITVAISDDLLDELDETFTVNLANASNATIADAQGIGTIVDNDGTPNATINDVTVNEAAGTVTFTVTLDAPSALSISVDYALAGGTATAGNDYTAVSGTLTFAPGITTQTITVPLLNDVLFEQSENFAVNLGNPVNVTIADGLGIGTINDDGTGAGGADNDTPTISVGNVVVEEGTDPYAVFTVSLSNPSTTPVTFSVSFADGTATGPDYGPAVEVSTDGGVTWIPAAAATFAPGATSVLVRTPVTDDVLNESTETFTMNVAVTAGITTNAGASATATINDPDNSLSGSVYVDANNNGVFDPGETPIAGATVTLTGTNDLGAPVSLSALTNGAGTYEFLNLRPGTYTLAETQPGGYLDGMDALGSLGGVLGNDTFSGITTSASQTGTGYNFGELQPASISGMVFQDFDVNGVMNGADSGIVNTTVTLTGTDDLGAPVSLVTTTDAAGLYSFSGLRPGIYSVTETQPAGYLDGADTPGSAGGLVSANDVISGVALASGTNATNYGFAEIFPFDPNKAIVSTDNPGTTGSNVSIGELVRYRLVVALPDGLMDGFIIEEQLPSGLIFLNDGTTALALVSLSGIGVTSTTLAGPGLGGTNPNSAPTFLLPGTAISSSPVGDVDVYGSGTDVYFKLGDITNTETGVPAGQFVVLEFNARVENLLSNQSGTTLDNVFRPLIDLDGDGTSDVIPGGVISSPVTATIAEPILYVDKVLVSGSSTPRFGDTLAFTVTIGHASGSDATAWEVIFSDALPAGLAFESVVTTATGGAVVSTSVAPNIAGALTGQFDIPLGGQITITYRVKVVVNSPGNVAILNAADVTWSSLPGNGPAERRAGDGFLGEGGLNDYVVRDTVSVNASTTAAMSYAYDAFNDFAKATPVRPSGKPGTAVGSPDIYRQPLLPLAPVYSGAADPGSSLVLTLYNTKGEIIGIQTVTADAGGNWMATFPTATVRDYPNSVQMTQSSVFYSLSNPHGHNLRTYYSPALNAGHFMFSELRMISDGGPTPLLGDLGMRNPLQFGAMKFGGELLTAPGTPGGY
ncbi:MAG: Calx-beta domain-containing protein, partial [Chthoniobacteraceae bacterium]